MTEGTGLVDLPLLTIAVFVIIAVISATILVAIWGESSSRARIVARRLKSLEARTMVLQRGLSDKTPTASIRLPNDGNASFAVKALAGLVPNPKKLRERISRTGYDISIGAYATVCVAIVAINSFSLWFFADVPLLLGFLGSLGIGIGIPHLVVSYLINKRTKKFLAVFPEAIELIVRGIKSGMPVTEEVATVGREIVDPVGLEFRRISDRVRLGQTLDQALWIAARRLEITDFNFFAISISVQRETGGNLAETLSNLADVLRKRRQMKLKIRAVTSEARASAIIIGLLPFIMLAILSILSPDYIGTLVSDPRGRIVSVVALLLMSMGGGVMAKMVRFEV